MQPSDIRLHKRTAILELCYPDDTSYSLSAEYLRVYSPSAEVRGHGKGQEILQTGKLNVKIDRIEPTGNYAVMLHFDDGHNSGIYSWDYLYELGVNHGKYWDDYLQRLQAAGERREPKTEGVQVVNIMPLQPK